MANTITHIQFISQTQLPCTLMPWQLPSPNTHTPSILSTYCTRSVNMHAFINTFIIHGVHMHVKSRLSLSSHCWVGMHLQHCNTPMALCNQTVHKQCNNVNTHYTYAHTLSHTHTRAHTHTCKHNQPLTHMHTHTETYSCVSNIMLSSAMRHPKKQHCNPSQACLQHSHWHTQDNAPNTPSSCITSSCRCL